METLSLETLSVETLGAGGAVTAFVVAFILWKLFKLALKLVLFIVVVGALVAGAAVYVERNPSALPTGPLTR